MNIGYIGSSATMIKILKDWKNHNICVWFCDSSKESSELELLSEKMQVSLFYINKEEQIIEQMAKCPKQIDYFIVYKTGIIIHEKMLDKYSDTLTSIENEISETQDSLFALMNELTGSEFDMKGLAELQKLFGGM